MFEDPNFKVPELTKNADLDDASFNAFKEIYTNCMAVDPAKRWTMKQVKTKMDATLKAAKLVNPPASAEYDETDFKPFFDHISKKQGKPSTELFKKHTELLKMLGKIPIPIPKRIEIKSLPIHDEVEDAKGKKFFFQGNLDEKKQPKGLGCKFSDIGFEFGVYGEAPFCVTKLKTEKDTITIIPNSTKPMKTHVNLNGVVIKGYGYVYGKMNFPDGRYYEGGFEKDGDFKGVGRYLDSNGDFYHGEWVNSKWEGLGKLFDKKENKWTYGIFKGSVVGINPKDMKDLDADPKCKVATAMSFEDWKKQVAAKKLDAYF